MSNERNDIYEFEGFRLDVREHILELADRSRNINLPNKAFQTLVVLVRNHGRLVTKSQLLEAVWPDSFVEENNLDKAVHAIRNALGKRGGGHEYVETVRKHGYRFVAVVRIGEHLDIVSTLSKKAALDDCMIREEVDDFDGAARLIGRRGEIGRILRLLLEPTIRLVTMTGVGGIGKTRLAREVARFAEDLFPEGVFFVDLSSVSKPDYVGTTIASAFGISEATADQTFEVLKSSLRSRRMLIVLDNIEQVVSSSVQIADLIEASDKLKMLVTSRVLLHLQKEHEFVVPPLSVPSNVGIIDECLKADAIQLFAERARSAKASFVLSSENAFDVAKICVRLEGLPLAIELAAAWVKMLSPSSILRKLENRLNLLTKGPIDSPRRHQTMRAAVEWSFNLLSMSEKQLFQNLSVFSGGFTLEDAEGVIFAGPGLSTNITGNISAWRNTDVLDGTRSLVEQSLVSVNEQPDGNSRFRMLEVVREFAVEMLATQDNKECIRRRHAKYFLELAENTELRGTNGPQPVWIERFEHSHDNFKAAMDWFSEHDAESELRLCAALCDFWLVRSYYLEGLNRLRSALKANREQTSSASLRAIRGAGQICFRLGDSATARDFFNQGIQVCRKAGDARQEALMGISLGLLLAAREEEYESARNLITRSLKLGRGLGDQYILMKSLSALGTLECLRENYKGSEQFFQEVVMLAGETGNQVSLSSTLINFGTLHFQEGNYEAAENCIFEGLTIAEKLNYRLYIYAALESLAAVAVKQQEMHRAARLAGASEILLQLSDYKPLPAETRIHNANLAELTTALSIPALAMAYNEGRAMNQDEAVALALRRE